MYATRALLVGAAALRVPPIRMDEFARGTDILPMGSEKVSKRAIVNVLGRWKSHRDWNEAGIGRKGKLDDFRSGDYYDDDVKSLKTDFTKPMEFYIARRPQFLNFCERYGLVARWVHEETVSELPFTDAALAASVGATVEELNAEPVDPLAAEIVFDALSGSAAGFVLEEQCDEMRSSFLTADGGFDEGAFGAALDTTRRNLAGVLLFGPGIGLLSILLIGIHWLPQIIEGTQQFNARLERNFDAGGPAILVLPILAVGVLAAEALNFTPAFEREGGEYTPSSILDSTRFDREGADVGNEMSMAGSTPPGYNIQTEPRLSDKQPSPFAPERQEGLPRGPGGRPLDFKELAILKQDQLFLERAIAKKRGQVKEGDEEEEEMPNLMDDEVIEAYFKKQWEGGLKSIFPFLG
jgi:hypothetical protein